METRIQVVKFARKTKMAIWTGLVYFHLLFVKYEMSIHERSRCTDPVSTNNRVLSQSQFKYWTCRFCVPVGSSTTRDCLEVLRHQVLSAACSQRLAWIVIFNTLTQQGGYYLCILPTCKVSLTPCCLICYVTVELCVLDIRRVDAWLHLSAWVMGMQILCLLHPVCIRNQSKSINACLFPES